MVTLGLASYGEFTLRRKLGLAFRLPGILPSRQKLKLEAKLAKDPPLRKKTKSESEKILNEDSEPEADRKISSESDRQSNSSLENDEANLNDQNIDKSLEPVEEISKKSALENFMIKLFSPIETFFRKMKNFMFTRGVEFLINFAFLVINYIHLIYLGYTFSHTDLSMKQTLELYEDFRYISPILVSIVLFYAHLL